MTAGSILTAREVAARIDAVTADDIIAAVQVLTCDHVLDSVITFEYHHSV